MLQCPDTSSRGLEYSRLHVASACLALVLDILWVTPYARLVCILCQSGLHSTPVETFAIRILGAVGFTESLVIA